MNSIVLANNGCYSIKKLLIRLLLSKRRISLTFSERKSYQQFAVSKKTSIFAVPKSETRNNNAKYIKQ